jgi:ribosomal protein L29
MDNATRTEIADLLTALAEKREWDHKTWARCHELVQANLDNELLDLFYRDLLSYPGLFNVRFTALNPTKVSVMQVEPNPTLLEEVRTEFTRVSAALRTHK